VPKVKSVPEQLHEWLIQTLCSGDVKAYHERNKLLRSIYLEMYDQESAPWCYIPIGAYASEMQIEIDRYKGNDETGYQFQLFKTNQMRSAVVPWYAGGKGIYRFDPSFFEEVLQTDIDTITAESVLRLPEWSCYVPFPQALMLNDVPVYGLFVYADKDLRDTVPELRLTFILGWTHTENLQKFLYDCPYADLPLYVHIQQGEDSDIYSAINLIAEGEEHNREAHGLLKAAMLIFHFDDEDQSRQALRYLLKIGTSIAMVLCANNIDIKPLNAEATSQVKRTGSHTNTPNDHLSPESPRKWEVGERFGSAIRAWKTEFADLSSVEQLPTGKKGLQKRPHLRRAHFHSFWIGPRKSDKREKILHWIPPTFINDNGEDMPVVIHPVKKQ